MSSVTPVVSNGITYAIFVCGRPPVDPVQFYSKPTDEFQVGVFERPAGHEVKAHTHPPIERSIHYTSEFLSVDKGRIRATVFDEQWKELAVHELGAGDFLIFFRGGHRIEILEDCRFVEVKQGPFPGDAAAKTFR